MYGKGELLLSEEQFEAVSFVIPAHNEAQYLRPTLKAIHRAIEKLELIAEVIVVNDASTDDTAEIARDNGAVVINVDLRNIGAVRNAGANTTSYPWIIFVDADTQIPIDTVRASLQHLANGGAGGGAHVAIPNPEQLFFAKRWMYYLVVIVWQVLGRWAAGCYMFCRRDLFEQFGGFDENYFAAEEYFFSRQLKQRGRFQIVRPPVLTSARKLHAYSTWELVRFLLIPMLNFRQLFQSKRGLELLYEDQR